MDALGGNEQLLLQAVAVRVTEVDAGQRGTTARVVDDVLHNTLSSCQNNTSISMRYLISGAATGSTSALRESIAGAPENK